MSSSASSSPMRQGPKPSPRSALRSISMDGLLKAVVKTGTADRRSRPALRPVPRWLRRRLRAVPEPGPTVVRSSGTPAPVQPPRCLPLAPGAFRAGVGAQEDTEARRRHRNGLFLSGRPVAGPDAVALGLAAAPQPQASSGTRQFQAVDVGRREPGRDCRNVIERVVIGQGSGCGKGRAAAVPRRAICGFRRRPPERRPSPSR